uniref:Aminomethyltransferase n=1 Tax=Chrysotila carterae TaxID=13221 RepID=A0A7S4FCK3_CHRCT
MAAFGGWDMPIQYPDGIMKSHLHTREKAGLFDVSHMLGVVVRGADRVAFMESLCVADIKAIPAGMGGLSVITNADGGIIDDCIITNAGDHLYMVINAGHEDKDIPHMEKHLKEFVAKGGDASVETLPDNGILALQGPEAAKVLQTLTKTDLSQMSFMAAMPMEVAGQQCFVARSGYTGEDGFEIAVPKGSGATHGVVTLWEALMAHEDVMPVGLGARDSLRLEAGLCLYGNDLDDTTSPVEGTLLWVIAKRRRDEPGSFVGSERILSELANKSATRKRAGFVVPAGAPVREGTAVFDEAGEKVGVTTSGGFSPCLKKGIGMCYVKPGLIKAGTELFAEVRGKKQKIVITKMPFVEQKYYRGP